MIIASLSGGKDSTAMALYLRENGIEFRSVFMDTSWEHPDTYEHLEYLRGIIGEIEVIKPPLGFADLCRKKGMFPGRMCRFCTQQLKIYPFLRWLSKSSLEGAVNAVGIRAGESRARAKLTERSDSVDGSGVSVWRPILRWTEQDVMDIHSRHGVRPNPLYLRASTRVGCWPCIFSRKSEIRAVADETPWRIDEIRHLESDVQDSARRRYEARGETMKGRGYEPPTFFTVASNKMRPIDDVVRWSRTSRGGKQSELFGPEPGCIRWGMCSS